MHKKRAVAVTCVVLIIMLAIVMVSSQYHYRKNADILIIAMNTMAVNPEDGFEICGRLTMKELAKNCYTNYMGMEIGRIKAKYSTLDSLSPEEKKEATINMLNEISEKVEKACSVDVMEKESQTCPIVKQTIELQKSKAIAGSS